MWVCKSTTMKTLLLKQVYETILKIKMILSKKNGTAEWDLIDELKFKDHIDLIIQRYKRGQRFGPILPATT